MTTIRIMYIAYYEVRRTCITMHVLYIQCFAMSACHNYCFVITACSYTCFALYAESTTYLACMLPWVPCVHARLGGRTGQVLSVQINSVFSR